MSKLEQQLMDIQKLRRINEEKVDHYITEVKSDLCIIACILLCYGMLLDTYIKYVGLIVLTILLIGGIGATYEDAQEVRRRQKLLEWAIKLENSCKKDIEAFNQANVND